MFGHFHRFRGVVAIASVGVVTACAGAESTATAAAEMACPELGGSVDPMLLSYSDDAAANGRIRAFLSATRGLYDAALEMERMASDACARIRNESGEPTQASSGLSACDALLTDLAMLARNGIEIRVSVATPRCKPSAERRDRCSASCGTSSGAECTSVCEAQAAIYGDCTLPGVSIAVSHETERLLKLARALERHLPNLFYAEMALGKRLTEHGKTLVSVAGKLPADVNEAGPHAMACVSLAATSAAKSFARLETVLAVCSKATASLNPEVHASEARVP
jgi:hypothetical protein